MPSAHLPARTPRARRRADPDPASFFSERGHAAAIDDELDTHLADLAESEGLDEAFVRECRELLSEETAEPVRGRSHLKSDLLLAKLELAVDRPERAETAATRALAIAPADVETRSLLAAVRHRQGRLTEAMHLWRVLAEERRTVPTALQLLGRIFELSFRSRQSEREWTAPADLIAAIPEGLGELERSFQMALAHDFPSAIRMVERVAARAHGKYPNAFKLAALQRAWLLEQMGDVPSAIQALERLADEPRLANDHDRLLALAALYEVDGAPVHLRRAVRVVRHVFLASREPMLLRRLARLLGRLGHDRLGELFEARYKEAFRRRLHDLTLREVVRAASTHHVPLERLMLMQYPTRSVQLLLRRHAGRRRSVHKRRAAILSILLGDTHRARTLLRAIDGNDEATPTDLAYLADLEHWEGDQGGARVLLARAASTGTDPEILVRLFGDPEWKETIDAGRLDHARRSVFSVARAHPERADAWRALARIEQLMELPKAAARHRRRAQTVGAIERQRIGRVLCAAAFRHAGDLRGVMHELWFSSRRVPKGRGGMLETHHVLGNVAPELRTQAVNVFHSTVSYAIARFAIDDIALGARRFTLKLTKEDEPSSGDSASLPIAIALVSALLGIPIRPDIALSGAIVTDAHDVITVRQVGDVDAKIEGAYERRLRTLVLPAGNREDVERAERVPPDVARGLVRFVSTLDEACEAVFGDDIFLTT